MSKQLTSGQNKSNVLEALEQHHGIVSEACRKCNISRQAFYNWMNDDEEFRKQAEALTEVAIDHVEGKLFKLIDELNPSAIIFYLKTKAKHRGYVEKQMVEIGEVSINLIDGTEGY